jgi:hypothetical protein
VHTKEEITKKRGKSSEQLDLAAGSASAADKLKHKRRWLFIALFITTGLSLLFWLYRTFKTTGFSPKLPQIKFALNRSPANGGLEINSQLSNLLSQHPEITGFYLGHDHPQASFSYGTVSDLNPDDLRAALVSLPSIQKSPNAALLPDGTVYHEHSADSAGQTVFSSLITNPIDQIFIIVRFKGPSASIKPLLPELISAAYWSASSN